MATKITDLSDIYTSGRAVVDVRTPAEFSQGHIPGSSNIALFSDEERAEVGTAYVQDSREEAIRRGLDFVGTKLSGFVDQAKEIAEDTDGKLRLYCWRGGMRSASMAWLFETAGMDVELIEGGYKTYRRHVLADLEKQWPYIVVGGRTGSKKTQVLHALHDLGEQVIDLEGIANHKGSAFGSLGQAPQPKSEMAMNLVHQFLIGFDTSRPIYIEDESLRIGTVALHPPMYEMMQAAPLIVLEVPNEERVRFLAEDYGNAEPAELAACFEKIKKKLGGDRLKKATEAVMSGDLKAAATMALEYYDGTYDYGIQRREEEQITRIECGSATPGEVAAKIVAAAQTVAG